MDNLRGYSEFLGIGEGTAATKAEADLVKAQALANLASKPAQKTNPLIFIIPVVGLLAVTIIFVIASKRKK